MKLHSPDAVTAEYKVEAATNTESLLLCIEYMLSTLTADFSVMVQ